MGVEGKGSNVLYLMLSETENIKFQIKRGDREEEVKKQQQHFKSFVKKISSMWTSKAAFLKEFEQLPLGSENEKELKQDVLSDFVIFLTLKGIHWGVSALVILQILNWYWLEGLLNTSWGLTFARLFFLPFPQITAKQCHRSSKCESLWEVTKTGSEGSLGGWE